MCRVFFLSVTTGGGPVTAGGVCDWTRVVACAVMKVSRGVEVVLSGRLEGEVNGEGGIKRVLLLLRVILQQANAGAYEL